MTNDKKNGFERLERVEIVRVWNRNKAKKEKKIYIVNKRGREES